MASPFGGIYVEILAPDLRFFIALIVGSVLIFSRDAEKKMQGTSSLRLAAYLFFVYVVWMFTSGNGRYFLPGLIIIGPVLIGLLNRVACSRGMKLAIASLVLMLQAWAVWQVHPAGAWAQTKWIQPNAFAVHLDELAKNQKSTYITLTSPSFSAVALQFDERSSWINLSSFQAGADSYESRRINAILEKSEVIYLLAPSGLVRASNERSISIQMLERLNERLEPENLSIKGANYCRFSVSSSLEPVTQINIFDEDNSVVKMAPSGFWICQLNYEHSAPKKMRPKLADETARAIAFIEKKCPRFFPRGEGFISETKGVVSVDYPGTDLNLKVYKNGEISYLYYLSLNRVQLGTVAHISAGKMQIECSRIIGRGVEAWTKK